TPRPARSSPAESSSENSAQTAPKRPASEAPVTDATEETQAHAPSEASTQVGAEAGGDIASVRGAWPAVVELVRGQNALLGALIEEAEPVAVSREELIVAFAAGAPFLKKKAEDPTNRAAVAAALAEVTGRRWQLTYELHAVARGGARGAGR